MSGTVSLSRWSVGLPASARGRRAQLGRAEGRKALGRATRTALCLMAAWLVSSLTCFAQQQLLDHATRLESQGRFAQAASALRKALDHGELSVPQRAQLEFELDRLHRIRLDYPLTEAALFEDLRKSVKNLTAEEYQDWLREGRFDSREIDGRRYFMVASVSNLFFRYPELNPRRLPARNSGPVERHHLEVCEAIKQAALTQHQPYVLPKHFEITMTVTADANAAPDGETIRAWLPIPRRYPFQDGFTLVSASSPPKATNSETNSARALYLEQPAHRSKPTEFKIQYQYTTRGVWFDIKPAEIKPADLNEPSLAQFTRETAHVQFTPEFRALSARIAGQETNPAVRAKKFYDWITDNIKYSFATEYSTIRNLSEYCRAHGYGDCGQEGLLFITLCRLNGIPARWQSGWTIFPGGKSNHDWTEIYLDPYGWVPVDPYMGIYAMRYANHLTGKQRHALRDFYFGGLDQYRMIANSDHDQALTPPKRTMRSDDVDFQRGELEWGTHNLYFDQFSYELTAKELPAVATKVE